MKEMAIEQIPRVAERALAGRKRPFAALADSDSDVEASGDDDYGWVDGDQVDAAELVDEVNDSAGPAVIDCVVDLYSRVESHS